MAVTSATVPCKRPLGEGINPDDRLLTGLDQADLGLVDPGLDAHVLRIGKLKDRLAFADGDPLFDLLIDPSPAVGLVDVDQDTVPRARRVQLSMHFWRLASRCFSSSNEASWFFLSASIALILASSDLRILGPVNFSSRSSMPWASSRAMLVCWSLSSSALSWTVVRNPFLLHVTRPLEVSFAAALSRSGRS